MEQALLTAWQKEVIEVVRYDAQRKFGMKIGAFFLDQELAKAHRIQALPKMVKPLTIEELKAFFTERTRELGPEVLK